MENKELNKFNKFMKDKNFFPSRKLGQNFLIDQNIKEKIVNSLQIEKNDFIVEIGPGFGALTKIIFSKTPHLSVIEFDKRLIEFLKSEFKDITIYESDVLKFDFSKVNDKHFKVISNLPYSISSKIIFKLLKEANFSESVLMVQKEMADRIISKCGSKKYNNFTVLLAITTKIKKLFDVPPKCFYPQPEIHSSVISFSKNQNFDFNNFEKLEKFLQKCFSQKRKTIYNNLKNYYPVEKINKILQEANIDPKDRPENINVDVYEKIYLKFYEI